MPCSLDAKGRVKLPAKLLKQLGEEHSSDFTLKFDRKKGILLLFPRSVWESQLDRISKLNMLIERNREFARRHSAGTQEVGKDSSDRINLPNYMIEALEFKSEVMVYAYLDTIEIWPLDKYENYLADDSYDVGAESEAIFDDQNPET